jgi:glycosyltransferase involved in cell wall biosynthesis
MTFSVIIPVRGDPRLGRCLDALRRQSLDRQEYEILVVDDDPSPETRRIAESHSARYLAGTRAGAYAARDLGITESRGDMLAFTDADCLPPPDWLGTIRSAFASHACDVAVGPSYALNADPVGLLVQATDDERWASLAREGWVTYCDTRNLAGRREMFLDEPFDATFRYAGDLEWAVRASRRGYRTRFVPAMAVGHENVSSLRDVWRRGVRRGRGLAAVYRKHGRAARISGARPLRILGIDAKERLVAVVTHPVLRPVARAALVGGASFAMALAGLSLRLRGLDRWTPRAFRLLDRATLLLGRIQGR